MHVVHVCTNLVESLLITNENPEGQTKQFPLVLQLVSAKQLLLDSEYP